MIRMLTGSIAGAALIFLWQFASWTFLDLHRPQQQYTPHQDTILSFLNEHLNADGGFFLPTVPQSASMEEMQQLSEQSIGKPWAQVFYHKTMKDNMTRNMLRNFLINIVVVLLFMWILKCIPDPTFTGILLSSLAAGLIVFFNAHYVEHIWYQTFDLNAHLLDSVISWSLVGLWLGWWMRRGKQTAAANG